MLASSTAFGWTGHHVQTGHDSGWCVDDLIVQRQDRARNRDAKALVVERRKARGFRRDVIPQCMLRIPPAGSRCSGRVPRTSPWGSTVRDPARIRSLTVGLPAMQPGLVPPRCRRCWRWALQAVQADVPALSAWPPPFHSVNALLPEATRCDLPAVIAPALARFLSTAPA